MDAAQKQAIASPDFILGARATVRELYTTLRTRKARADRLEIEHEGIPIILQPGPRMTRVRIGAEGDTDALEGTIPTTWITDDPTPADTTARAG